MRVAPLPSSGADELMRLAREPGVLTNGQHLATDGIEVWRDWIGTPDPNRQMTLGVWDEQPALLAAMRVRPWPRRRMMHAGVVELLASGDSSADGPVHALLSVGLEAIDRWYALPRLELHAPAGHDRVEGLFAEHGFELEVVRRRAVITDGVARDEAQLARLRAPLDRFEEIELPPLPARSAPPADGDLRIRPVSPEDGHWNARSMSEIGTLIGTAQLPFQRGEHWVARLTGNSPTSRFCYAVEVDSEPVGMGVLIGEPAVRRRHCATLGMHLSTAAQGRGVGPRVLAFLIAESDRLDIRRLELGVFERNERARRIYERAGFELEGRNRHDVFRSGAYASSLIMSRLRG